MEDNREAGFTLIESLVVLFVVSLLLFMPILSIHRVVESIKIDLFFRELSSNITLMQNHAILNGEQTRIEFSPSQNSIRFRVLGSKKGSHHPLNQTIDLGEESYKLQGTGYRQVTFYAHTGNISITDRQWRFNIETTQGIYELVFQIGSGRFDIRKR